jgi:hypothetical protein
VHTLAALLLFGTAAGAGAAHDGFVQPSTVPQCVN